MALKRVYIETSIPSFYHESRREPEMAARRNWTRLWWDERRHAYELVTSMAVLDELRRGDYPSKAEVLSLVADISLLPVERPVLNIVQAYINHSIMPRDPVGDAFHLALASHHKCDFLLTWNCNHLANANKFRHIQQVNTLLGLFVPTITTPLELLSEEDRP